VTQFGPLKVKVVDCVWNVMAHAQKPDFVFRQNGRVHLSRWGCQFSRLLAAEVCALVVVLLDIPCSEEVWRLLATHSICQFPLHFPSHMSPCAITFQLDSTSFSQSAGWWVKFVAWTLFHLLFNSPDFEAKLFDCWQDVFQEAQGIMEVLEN
jgi:hypothetical protein